MYMYFLNNIFFSKIINSYITIKESIKNFPTHSLSFKSTSIVVEQIFLMFLIITILKESKV